MIGKIKDEKTVVRFWTKVKIPENFTQECWLWTSSLDTRGYGQFKIERKTRKSHQIAYEAMNENGVPQGLELDHLCRVRNCVSPYHLEPVTHQENCVRSLRWNGVTCKNGHTWEDSNTIKVRGGRSCRICRNEYKVRLYHMNKERFQS